MNQTRRDLLKALCLFPFVGKIPVPKEPARRIVHEVVEKIIIGTEVGSSYTFDIRSMPLPIVHQGFYHWANGKLVEDPRRTLKDIARLRGISEQEIEATFPKEREVEDGQAQQGESV